MKVAYDAVDDDLAVFLETDAWLALAEHHPSEAVAKYHRSLDVLKRTRGQQHWLTGWEYMLLGRAYAELGDTNNALADMREGLLILDHALAIGTPSISLRKWCIRTFSIKRDLMLTPHKSKPRQSKPVELFIATNALAVPSM